MDYFKLTKADEKLSNDKASLALYYDKAYIGMFSAADEASGTAILKQAVEQLKSLGHNKIIAPIDNNTWFSYRIVSYDSGHPAFPNELANPLWYNQCFLQAGFKPAEEYFSYIFDINIADISKPSGLTIRNLDMNNFDAEMEIIYHLSMQNFKQNYLFDKISLEQFLMLYSKFKTIIDPRLVYIAELDGKAVAFLFCFNGLEQRLVLKTMAVDKLYREKKIGSYLINLALKDAQQLGYQKAIGAFVRAGNYSGKIVEKYQAEIIRKYAIYEWES